MSDAVLPPPSSARVPFPLFFVAGAAFGILLASLIVLCTHSTRHARGTNSVLVAAPVVAQWQPNVVTIHPAAPDPMFDTPPAVEPASLSARPRTAPVTAAAPVAPAAKKVVTRNAVRHHASANRAGAVQQAGAAQPSSADLLTAAL